MFVFLVGLRYKEETAVGILSEENDGEHFALQVFQQTTDNNGRKTTGLDEEICLLNRYQQTTDNTKQTTNNTKQRTDNIKQTTNWLKKGLQLTLTFDKQCSPEMFQDTKALDQSLDNVPFFLPFF